MGHSGRYLSILLTEWCHVGLSCSPYDCPGIVFRCFNVPSGSPNWITARLLWVVIGRAHSPSVFSGRVSCRFLFAGPRLALEVVRLDFSQEIRPVTHFMSLSLPEATNAGSFLCRTDPEGFSGLRGLLSGLYKGKSNACD